MRRLPRALPLALVCATACSVPEQQYQGITLETVIEVPVTPNHDLDMLFVIDNSPSMADKQQNLANNFPNFINQLNASEGGLPNVHIGVVNTDLGTKGSGNPTPGPPIGQVGQGGCAGTGNSGKLTTNGASVTGAFLSDIKSTDGTRIKNYTGNLADVFGQMARLGAGGCGFEQPLAAMQAALSNNPANAGFLRQDALLAVIFLTDEDDCSITDPAILGPAGPMFGDLQSFRCTRFGVTCAVGGQTPDAMNAVGAKDQCTASTTSPFMDSVAGYRNFLVGLKADPTHVLVGGIMGEPQPVATELRTLNGVESPALAHSCSYIGSTGSDEVADPAVRLATFFGLFPDRSVLSTICQPDLSGALTDIGRLVVRTVGNPCLTVSLFDVDPATPGVQEDCVVEDTINNTTITAIDKCGAAPCWRLVADPLLCPESDHLKLQIDRTATAPDPATVTRMRCRLQ